MAYPTLPDRRMAWHIDGTSSWQGGRPNGPSYKQTQTEMTNCNHWSNYDGDYRNSFGDYRQAFWFFFPEKRVITAYWGWYWTAEWQYGGLYRQISAVYGSADTTNGLDGTWEAAYMPQGLPSRATSSSWRDSIKPCSFSQSIKCLRLEYNMYGNNSGYVAGFGNHHFYGHKDATQTPDDIIFIDATSGIEFPLDLDWGDLPVGAPVIKQFKIKNVSPTKTANTIVITCSDTDFTISEDNNTYGTTINLSSLTSGSSSSTYYVKGLPPSDGAPGVRAPYMSVSVGSWT